MEKNGYSNRSRTMQLLFAHGSLSRTDIAQKLNITTAAVTSIVNELLSDGILIQEEDAPTSPLPRSGRRRMPLHLHYDWKYVLAIDIHSYYVNIAVTNLAGQIQAEETNIDPAAATPEEMCRNISNECIKMLWRSSISTDMILGAGITIIGPVDHHRGIALQPFRLFDQAIPLRDYFEKEFPFPVVIESNVCSFLMSELLYTTITQDAENILMLKWGPGVGSAMAIHRLIYKGHNYQSTEIGHNQIAEQGGKKCNCGRTGCLEPSISMDAIIDHIGLAIMQNPEGSLAKQSRLIGSPTRQNLLQYLDLTKEGDELYLFLQSCAHELAKVTNNAIHLLAPDRLVLIGDLFSHPLIVKIFQQQLYQINPLLSDDLCLQARSVADKKYIGATAAVINQFLLNHPMSPQSTTI